MEQPLVVLEPTALEQPTHTPVFIWAYCTADSESVIFTGPWTSEALALQYPPRSVASRRLLRVDVPHESLRPVLPIAPVCPDCGGMITTSQGRHDARCIRAVCRYVGPGVVR